MIGCFLKVITVILNAWHRVRFTHIRIVISKLFFVLILGLKPSSDQKFTRRWNCFCWLQRKAATTWTGLSLLDWHQLMVSLWLSLSSQQWLVLNASLIICLTANWCFVAKLADQVSQKQTTSWKCRISEKAKRKPPHQFVYGIVMIQALKFQFTAKLIMSLPLSATGSTTSDISTFCFPFHQYWKYNYLLLHYYNARWYSQMLQIIPDDNTAWKVLIFSIGPQHFISFRL